MGRNFRLAGALLAVVFAAAACDDESPTETQGDQLTQVETEELANVVMSTTFAGLMAFGQQSQQDAAPASGFAPQAEGSLEFEQVVDCALGGNRSVDVSIDFTTSENGDSSTVVIDGTQTAEDCGLPFQNGTIVLNGNPNVTLHANLAFADGRPDGEQTASYDGGFAWEFGDRSGECAIDIDSSVTVEMESEQSISISQEVAGTLCGRSVERTFTFTYNGGTGA